MPSPGSLWSSPSPAVKPLLFNLICVFLAVTGVPLAVHFTARYYLELSGTQAGIAAAVSVQAVLVLFVFYAISFVSAAEKEGGQRETGKAD